MWQLLLTAAVAGYTGFIAKHTFTNYHSQSDKCEEEENLQQSPAFDSPLVTKGYHGYESNCDQDGIFRFSSSAGGSRGKKKKSTSLKEKSGVLCRRLKFGTGNGNGKRSGRLEVISGRKLSACLKKRRTVKCGSCSSKDSSLFGWGLGVGIMNMMSAGKAEITRLSTAMEETSKVVHELRTELYKRKSTQVGTSSNKFITEQMQLVVNRTSMVDRDPSGMKMCGLPMADDVECPSSVLTEEPEPVVLEMDQLEAELESELQKLPWSSTEISGHEVTGPNFGKAEVSSEGFYKLEGQNTSSYQSHGVLPSELDNKLCHLLIEQQENEIMGLDSELHLAQSQLLEKETELQALKDCVRRLTEFSLSTLSDDEVEVPPELECNTESDKNSQMGSESRKSVVGMKRPIDSA